MFNPSSRTTRLGQRGAPTRPVLHFNAAINGRRYRMKRPGLRLPIIMIAAAAILLAFNSVLAQPAQSGTPKSTVPQTRWPDEFGQSIANQILQEARKKAVGGATGPIEVNLKFTITPFGPPIEKPTWTPEDIKNLDVCAQICASVKCYVQCSLPGISLNLPPSLASTGSCDAIRRNYFRELLANHCLDNPVRKPRP